jgi:hypothetical protein
MPWLKRKVKIGEIETSGLGRIFWELGGAESGELRGGRERERERERERDREDRME